MESDGAEDGSGTDEKLDGGAGATESRGEDRVSTGGCQMDGIHGGSAPLALLNAVAARSASGVGVAAGWLTKRWRGGRSTPELWRAPDT